MPNHTSCLRSDPELVRHGGSACQQNGLSLASISHDEDLRNLLVGQAKNPDTPFQIYNWSVKEPMTGDWREKVRTRIRSTDLTIVICGQSTHTATGVAAELSITREEKKPYFLLWGRSDKTWSKQERCQACVVDLFALSMIGRNDGS